MQSPIPSYLEDILDQVRDNHDGEVADYIPELAEADPNPLGIALCTTSGHMYSAGDATTEFTIQSISKPFIFALALQELGLEEVKKVVGMEPSGEAFNELSLNDDDHRPVNPMINAGAIAVTQLINGSDSKPIDREKKIIHYLSQLAGRELSVDQEVCDSEIGCAERNLSLAHMLRSYDVIKDDAHDAVGTYTTQCSLLVTAEDLAAMAATLANGGRQPVTKEKILDADVCRLTLAVMSSAGMYDGAGRWMAEVGIPAKSGVAGGLIGSLPGQIGLATFSPRLDPEGNSVRGAEAFKLLSHEMGLHLMSTADRYGVHAIRSVNKKGNDIIVDIQGYVDFNAAETILHNLSERNLDADTVVLNFSDVTGSNKMGRRMLKEGLGRLRHDSRKIAVIGSGFFNNPTLSDGSEIPLRELDT